MTTPDYREQAAEVWRAIGEDPNMHLAPNATAMMHLASWASRIAEEERRKREAFEDLAIAYRDAENHWSNVYLSKTAEEARRACFKARASLDNAIEVARGSRVSGGET